MCWMHRRVVDKMVRKWRRKQHQTKEQYNQSDDFKKDKSLAALNGLIRARVSNGCKTSTPTSHMQLLETNGMRRMQKLEPIAKRLMITNFGCMWPLDISSLVRLKLVNGCALPPIPRIPRSSPSDLLFRWNKAMLHLMTKCLKAFDEVQMCLTTRCCPTTRPKLGNSQMPRSNLLILLRIVPREKRNICF